MQAASTSSRVLLAAVGLVMLGLSVGVAANFMKDRQQRQAVAMALTGGDPALAPAIFRRYGCVGCHVIPGIPGADGKVGGQLVDLRQRVYIGGVLNNTPDNLADWIVSPQLFSPQSAMPATGISQADARHLAAYLYGQ